MKLNGIINTIVGTVVREAAKVLAPKKTKTRTAASKTGATKTAKPAKGTAPASLQKQVRETAKKARKAARVTRQIGRR